MAYPPKLSTQNHIEAFRLSKKKYIVFDGKGAYEQGGRWTTPGRYVINLSSSFALAVLENLVHWNRSKLPPHMHFCQISISSNIPYEIIKPLQLKAGWDSWMDYSRTQPLGDDWYDRGTAAVLIVPSVLSRFDFNILINQRHRDVRKISVGDEMVYSGDPRLTVATQKKKGRKKRS